MRVLVACEESQVVCKAFRERGHEAYSCDILPTSGDHPEWHFECDAYEAIQYKGPWDLLIAHPPCTYLSKAGAVRLYPKAGQINEFRYRLGLDAKEFFEELLNAPIAKICVENPVSLTVFKMPPFTQEIEPWQFGHPVSKRTRLWLRNLHPLIPTEIVEKKGTYLPSSTSNNAYSGKNDKLTRDPKVASKTFEGIAKAMAQQWG